MLLQFLKHLQFFFWEFVQTVFLEKHYVLKRKTQVLNMIDQMIIQHGKIGMAIVRIIDMKYLNQNILMMILIIP